MKKKIKPVIAFAIVKKANPKISAFEIYGEKDVFILPNEMMIEVEIMPIDKKIVKTMKL